MESKQEIGSRTACGGFENERSVEDKFNNYQNDKDAQLWLTTMGYNLSHIQQLKAIRIPPRINKTSLLELGISENKVEETQIFKKADIQVQLSIYIDNIIYRENLSLKKAEKFANFNQIDKRKIDTYSKFWNFPSNIIQSLKLFTGEINPEKINTIKCTHLRDKRRVFLDEMPKGLQNQLITFFEQNKIMVITDLVRGRGFLAADWILCTWNERDQLTKWVIVDINFALNIFCQGNVQISPKGSLWIGNVFMQRKGGTPDPTSLQFKIKPSLLVEGHHV